MNATSRAVPTGRRSTSPKDAELEHFRPVKVPRHKYPWTFWLNAGLTAVNATLGVTGLVTRDWGSAAVGFGAAMFTALLALWCYSTHQKHRVVMQGYQDSQDLTRAEVLGLYHRYRAAYGEQEAYAEFLLHWGAKSLENLGIEPPKENSVGSA